MRDTAVTILCLAILGLFSLQAAEVTLADNGKAEYRIVVSRDADVSTKAVADDFAGILAQITGAEFAIVADETEPREHEIIVGENNARLAKLGLSQMTEGFTRGEHEMRTVVKHLVMAGEEPVGANLLSNSDFERDSDADGVPDGWQADGDYLPEPYSVDPEGVALDASKAYSGQSSVRLTKTPSQESIVSLRQRFEAETGQSYRATVRCQADIKKGSVHIIFTCFDREGKWLRHLSGARGVNQTGDNSVELSVDTKCEDDTAALMVEFLFYDDRSRGSRGSTTSSAQRWRSRRGETTG